MTPEEKLARVNRMKWLARIIGFLALGFFLATLIEGVIRENQDVGSVTFDTPSILLFLFVPFILFGCLASWWRLRLAAIMLVLTSVAIGTHAAVYAQTDQFYLWFIWGAPYLVAGVIFLMAWGVKRSAEADLSLDRANIPPEEF